ncbi:MAG: ethanolamine utilization protein EutN [Myxococcales bacterium]|nr:ethanolamine utilization protein EutN [Myxococcales bacterium]
MILGRVVGEVWATQKHAALDGRKLLIIQPYLWYAPSHEVAHLVAVDAIGAGVGEDVVVCMGEPARRSLGSSSMPVEAAVCAIVDRVELSRDHGKRELTFVGGRAPAHDTAGEGGS